MTESGRDGSTAVVVVYGRAHLIDSNKTARVIEREQSPKHQPIRSHPIEPGAYSRNARSATALGVIDLTAKSEKGSYEHELDWDTANDPGQSD